MNATPSPEGAVSAPSQKINRRGIRLQNDIGQTAIPGNPPPIRLPLKSITADPSIQQRVEMDPALVAEYQIDIGDWIQAAPVVVFGSNGLYWLADGFHRLCAADEAGLTEIPAVTHQGGRSDALKYALGANARHGKRRNPGDLAKAYRRAVAEQLVEPGDVEAVASLLNCSRRAASDLTRAVREQVKAERDATIQRLAAEGKTVRQIAEQIDIPKSTVDEAVRKMQSAKTGQAGDQGTEQVDPEPDAEIQEPVIEAMPGDDLDAIRQTTAKLASTPKVSAPAPAPATKGPTAKDAMHAMLQVTGSLGRLREFEDVMLESDAQTLIRELRKALERLVERFEQKVEGSGHA